MASNDNNDNPPGSDGPPTGGTVLRMIPCSADRHTRNLETLMADVYGHARETFALAKHEDDPDVLAILTKQGVSLANCYTQMVGAQDRHRKALREER